jgi:hypothetical protein
MPAADELERLTEAVDRLIVRLHSLKAKVVDLEGMIAAVAPGPSRDEEGHNLLRLHSARLLRERQELRRRIAGVLEKLERMQR